MNRVILTNSYGEEVCELIPNRYGTGYRVKDEDFIIFENLCVGDTYSVEEVWAEPYGDEVAYL